ncbi:MAG: hypothetical protein R8K20_05635 [Gallionellaceae bacterium]
MDVTNPSATDRFSLSSLESRKSWRPDNYQAIPPVYEPHSLEVFKGLRGHLDLASALFGETYIPVKQPLIDGELEAREIAAAVARGDIDSAADDMDWNAALRSVASSANDAGIPNRSATHQYDVETEKFDKKIADIEKLQKDLDEVSAAVGRAAIIEFGIGSVDALSLGSEELRRFAEKNGITEGGSQKDTINALRAALQNELGKVDSPDERNRLENLEIAADVERGDVDSAADDLFKERYRVEAKRAKQIDAERRAGLRDGLPIKTKEFPASETGSFTFYRSQERERTPVSGSKEKSTTIKPDWIAASNSAGSAAAEGGLKGLGKKIVQRGVKDGTFEFAGAARSVKLAGAIKTAGAVAGAGWSAYNEVSQAQKEGQSTATVAVRGFAAGVTDLAIGAATHPVVAVADAVTGGNFSSAIKQVVVIPTTLAGSERGVRAYKNAAKSGSYGVVIRTTHNAGEVWSERGVIGTFRALGQSFWIGFPKN